jgi:RNA polymerase sigma-70 factor (ECF subfamily)
MKKNRSNGEPYGTFLQRLQKGDRDAFVHIFRSFYKDLTLFAGTFLTAKADCEDIVQDILLHLWENRQTLEIKSSLQSFLLQSVRKACLDRIRHHAAVRKQASDTLSVPEPDDNETGHYILYSDLQRYFAGAQTRLPAQNREPFATNRPAGWNYAKIAGHVKVTQRTIEMRIRQAIERLRLDLKE